MDLTCEYWGRGGGGTELRGVGMMDESAGEEERRE